MILHQFPPMLSPLDPDMIFQDSLKMEASFRVSMEVWFLRNKKLVVTSLHGKIFILALAIRLHFSVPASGRKHAESNQEIVHKACEMKHSIKTCYENKKMQLRKWAWSSHNSLLFPSQALAKHEIIIINNTGGGGRGGTAFRIYP